MSIELGNFHSQLIVVPRPMVCVCDSVTMVMMVAMVADTDGMVKVLSEKTSDRLLGVHIMGAVSIVTIDNQPYQ